MRKMKPNIIRVQSLQPALLFSGFRQPGLKPIPGIFQFANGPDPWQHF
jgi:hypothetical protein